MLRSTGLNLEYKFRTEFWRARPLLRGRAKLEAKLGFKAVHVRLMKFTRFRLHHRKIDQRARIRTAVDSAAAEHGTGWAHLRNDLSKQNIHLYPSMQRLLAQYEPLAFRSVLEVASSSIVPPPSPLADRPVIPHLEPLSIKHDYTSQPTPAANRELKELIATMLRVDNATAAVTGASTSALKRVKVGGKSIDTSEVIKAADEWKNAWKDFETIDASVRVQHAH